jgi:hypothetical protein
MVFSVVLHDSMSRRLSLMNALVKKKLDSVVVVFTTTISAGSGENVLDTGNIPGILAPKSLGRAA